MPRFWALWLLSVILRGLGVIWMLVTLFVPIALVIAPRNSPPDMPNFYGLTAAFAGWTASALLVTMILSLIYGLMIYAAGQFIVLMLQIEENTRIRKRAGGADARLDPVDGPWSQPPTARRGVVRKPEPDEYAPPRPRR